MRTLQEEISFHDYIINATKLQDSNKVTAGCLVAGRFNEQDDFLHKKPKWLFQSLIKDCATPTQARSFQALTQNISQ